MYSPQLTSLVAYFRHPSGYLDMLLEGQPPVLNGGTPNPPEKSSPELQAARNFPHGAARVATITGIKIIHSFIKY